MKKRLFSLLLALVMVITMLPITSFAAAAPHIHQAAYAKAVTLDGNATETAWLLYGKVTGSAGAPTGAFDVLWNAETVYIAVNFDSIDSITVSLNSKTLTAALGDTLTLSGDLAAAASGMAGASAVELAIPMDSLGFTLLDYSQTVPFSISLSNGTAAASYEGLLGFKGTVRANKNLQSGFFASGYNNPAATDPIAASNNGYEDVDNGIRFFNLYSKTASNNDQVYISRIGQYIDASVTRWVEFDFHAAGMPVVAVPTAVNDVTSNYGFSFYMSCGQGICVPMGFVRTAEGLQFVAGAKRSTIQYVSIGKNIGDTFHAALAWSPDNLLHVYIDGQLIKTFDNVVVDIGPSGFINSGLFFTLWRRDTVAASEEDNYDITLTHISTGSGGNAGVLDNFKVEDILGANPTTDSVTVDLSLPVTRNNGQLSPVPLTWTSSVPAVISADGKVTRDTVDTPVILTATVTGTQISKSFDLTVPKLTVQAAIAGTAITHDGILNEAPWYNRMPMTAASGTAPTGEISALWDKNNLYLGISHTDADTLSVTLGSVGFTLNLADGSITENTAGAAAVVTTGGAEITVPFSALGIRPADYNQVLTTLQATLTGASGSVSLADRALDLILTGNVAETITGFASASNVTMTDGTAPFEAASGYALLGTSGKSWMNRERNITLVQTLCFTDLPEISGKMDQAYMFTDRYFFFLQQHPNYKMVDVTIYNAGNGKLMLRIANGKTDDSAPAAIDLGVSLGDTFRLETRWGTDDTLYIYVNSKLKGSFTNAGFTMAFSGSNWLYMCYTASTGTGKFTVSGLGVVTDPCSTLATEISQDVIFGSTDLSNVTSNLNLPTVFNSPYLGDVALTWESSDTTVLSNSGKVTRPAGKAGADIRLKLSAWDQHLWTADVFIPAVNQGTGATTDLISVPFSDTAITLDGTAGEVGWSLHNAIQASGKTVGEFGAQWQADNLYLAFDLKSETTLELQLNNKNVSVNLAQSVVTVDGNTVTGATVAVKNSYAELCIPFSAIGLRVRNYGLKIPFIAKLGAGTYQGQLKLTSIDRAASHNDAVGMKADAVGVSGATASDFVGADRTEDGYRLRDLYNYEGSNAINTRVYAIYMNNTLRPTLYDRTTTTFVEFDFLAASMPITTPSAATKWDSTIPCYGFTWDMTDKYIGDTNRNNVVSFGIFNTADGLMLVSLGLNGTKIVPMNREIGEVIRIGTAWAPDGSAVVYINGEKFITVENAERELGAIGNGIVSFNTYRSRTEAADCREDSLDIYVSHLAIGKIYGDTLSDSLTFASIRGENTDANAVTKDLELPAVAANHQLTQGQAITWTSSDPDVIDPVTGAVTQPAKGGKLVTLTATLEDNDSKQIAVYVKGIVPKGDVLTTENDLDPATGAGIAVDAHSFTLDETNNSIIAALEQVQPVNVVALTDGDAYSRLNEDVLTLWVSQDNVTYTQIENFKLLHKGNTWYLYDFSANAKYIKVHCTHFDGAEADFTGEPGKMIRAYYEEIFGAGDTGFSNSVQYVLTNETALDKRDDAWTISAAQLGVDTLGADVRVFLGEELLYHYVDGTDLIVRVPEVKAGKSVTLTVLYGNDNAMDIANKEYVYEVSYGAREMMINYGGYFITTRKDGVMVGMSNDANGQLYRSFSYNGGRTWTEPEAIACCTNWFGGHGGFIESTHTDRLIYHGHMGAFDPNNVDGSRMVTRFIYSDDGGETWNRLTELETDANYILSYSDGLELSCWDGEGENVDFVLPLGSLYNSSGSMCTRVAYSTDGGNTWKTSDTKIVFHDDSEIAGAESGLSESTIMERDDGVLVLIARCQAADSQNFARSYSYDHGITWTSPAELTDVYTVNTQPMLYRYDESELLLWSGNNILGGDTYQRTPISVAVSHDGMDTFVNIQDLYVKYSTQGLTRATRVQCTNPALRKWGEDTLVVNWTYHGTGKIITTRIENFTDYFYRTKGAYDHFETATGKYEGWSTILGTAEVSSEKYFDGARSLRFEDLSAAARSIPYLQSGVVSMEVYVANAAKADLAIALQATHSPEYGKGAPLGFLAKDGQLTFLGSENASGLTLQNGWNTFVFELDLAQGKANLSVNGSESVEMPVNTEIGTYLTYVYVMNNSSTPVYLDDFLAQDADTEMIPTESAPAIKESSISLKGTVDVNVYVEMGSRVASDDNAYMLFTMANGDEVKVPVSEAEKKTENGKTLYLFRCDVPAKEMTDTVKAQFFYGDGESTAEKTYSVKSYGDYILEDETGNYNAELKNLITHMLHYGAAAQKHFLHKTDDLANDGLDPISLDGVTAETLKDHAAKSGSSELVTFYGNSLILKGETTLRFFFQVAEGAQLTVTHNGKAMEIKHRDGLYFVSVENITAKDLDADVTLTVSDGETEFTVTANALTYVYNVLSRESDYSAELVELVKTLSLYSDAANEYFKQ